jgi:cell division protease FtsH
LNQLYKNLLTLAMVMVILLTIFSIWGGSHTRDAVSVPYYELVSRIESGEVDSLTIQGSHLRGKYRGGEPFKAEGPIEPDPAFLALLKEKQVKLAFEAKEDGGWLQSLLIGWLPMLLIVGLWFMLFRQLQSGGGKAMSFGKSRARLLNENEQRVTFADVAGVDEAKEELEEIVAFLRDPKKFTRLGGRIPKGVLLVGPPGTGKTLLARAIAGEAGVPFFSISGSDFVEMFVGVGASRVRDLFQQGKKHAPCIIFIDEIDAVGRHRGAGLGGGHDEREQTLNQMLVEMDGFESSEGVIIIAATNRPDVLDPAMLRPGRFDRHVVVQRPDLRGREAILRVHARRVLLAPDVDLNVIARGTPGFSGADLENLVNEAALIAARREGESVTNRDFELAKDKVLMGAERRSLVISEEEKRITAYHEAGHALVAMLEEHADPVHKVTIIPRGMALGVTMTMPEEDRHVMSKEQLLARMDHAMGGRAAEEIAFGLVSTGAANDLQQATRLAREMVCSFGMSEQLGPIHLGGDSETVFLGRELVSHPQHGPETARAIDAEIKRLLTEAYGRARKLLSDNRALLDRVAQALLERESLTEADLEVLRGGGSLPPLPAPEVAAPRPATVAARDPQVRAPAGFPDEGIPDPVPG